MVEIKQFYEFGDFRLDPTNKVLLRGGENVSITRKMFDTLNVLVENADRLVEKDELMRKIWHDRFVDESNLTFNIKMIRKALGDDATSPTYIKTVPRRGYRFIAEVRELIEQKERAAFVISPKEAPLVVIPQKEAPAFSRNSFLMAAILGIVLISSLGFASWWWKKNPGGSAAPILSARFDSARISDTGKVHHSVLSSDGKYVAYTNLVNGKESIWLRSLETSDNTPIIPPSDDLYLGLTFSKDGETLFFTRKSNQANEVAGLYRIPVFGGVPVKIAERCEGGITVSPDDKQILFVRYEPGIHDSNKLVVIDVDGQNEHEIKTSESPNVFWANAFSPDGKTIAAAYGHARNASQQMSLVEIGIETGEQHELTPEKFFHIKDIEWLPNKSGLLFSADQKIGNAIRMWKVDYATAKVESLTNDSTNYGEISLNKTADLLATTTVTADFHLYIQDENFPNSFKILTQARDKFAFTPDGRIAYATDSTGNEDIWLMNTDGTNQRQLTNNQALDTDPLVAPDNRYIFFTSNRTGESHVWRMNIDGSNQIQITQKDGGYPRFVTPDGKFLYYQSAMTNNLARVPTSGGDEVPFSEKIGDLPAFSTDGNRLAFLDRDKSTGKIDLKVISLATREILKTFPVPEAKGFIHYLRWKTGDTLAYSLDAVNAKDSVWVQNLNETSPKLLFDLDDEEFMDIQFSPDGQKTAFIRGTWRHDAFLIRGLK
jgi:Tol biopolymer transport system component/DNA-binding winged helix-turn-helix (wHTH) protein